MNELVIFYILGNGITIYKVIFLPYIIFFTNCEFWWNEKENISSGRHNMLLWNRT